MPSLVQLKNALFVSKQSLMITIKNAQSNNYRQNYEKNYENRDDRSFYSSRSYENQRFIRMSPPRVPQETYFNDFFDENCGLEGYHEDIIHQNLYIYHENEEQFHDANEKTLIEKKKRDFKDDEINVEFIFVTYYIITERKKKQFKCRICKKDFSSNNLLHIHIKIKSYSRKLSQKDSDFSKKLEIVPATMNPKLLRIIESSTPFSPVFDMTFRS